MNFLHGTTVLGTGTLTGNVAKLTLTNPLGVGTNHITATYLGNENYLTSTSSVLAQVINQASTATTLTSSLNPSNYGESVTFTATVAPAYGGTATGTVTFYHLGTVLGTGTLSGNVATLTLTSLGVGLSHITATYEGNSNYLSSTSSAVAQVVNEASTSTTITSSSNPSTHGSSVTFTAHVHPLSGPIPTGTITFKDGSTTLGTGTLDARATPRSAPLRWRSAPTPSLRHTVEAPPMRQALRRPSLK